MNVSLHNSIVLIDKPEGLSSFQTSKNAARKLGVRKSGHSGTLDINVSGVLVVALGEATKAIAQLVGLDKTYVGSMRLYNRINQRVFRAACKQFVGRIVQLPPELCAVKRVPRIRRVYSFDLTEFGEFEVRFVTKVQSGTYIRAIIRDLALMLNCRIEMSSLRRIMVGPFKIENCVTLDELSPERVINVADALEMIGLKKVFVEDEEIEHVRLGRIIFRDDAELQGKRVLVDKSGRALAMGRIVDGGIHPFRVFNIS